MIVYRQWWPANCLGHEQACIVFVSALARSFSFFCSQLGELGQQGFIQGSSAAEEEDLRLIQGMLILNTAGCTFNQHPRVTFQAPLRLYSLFFLDSLLSDPAQYRMDRKAFLDWFYAHLLMNLTGRKFHVSLTSPEFFSGGFWVMKSHCGCERMWGCSAEGCSSLTHHQPPSAWQMMLLLLFMIFLSLHLTCICASMQQTQHLFLINSFICFQLTNFAAELVSDSLLLCSCASVSLILNDLKCSNVRFYCFVEF